MYKMRTGILFTTMFLVMATFGQPQFHERRHYPKRELVNEEVVEAPEVVARVDGAGHAVELGTGDAATRTQYECPAGEATVKRVEAPGMGVVDKAAPDIDDLASSEVAVPTTLTRELKETKSSLDPTTTTAESGTTGPISQATSLPTIRTTTTTTTTTTVTLASADASLAPSVALTEKVTISQSTSDNAKGLGISYSPYNGDSSCKSQKQVNDDFSRLKGYSIVRSYGVDCNQVSTMLKAAKLHNKKLFIGVFEIKNLDKELQTLIKSVGSSWNRITTVAIGNELINSGKTGPDNVVKAVKKGRGILRKAGYSGPVVTVDTFNAIIDNPQLCHASDFCAANCHAFFDPNTSAKNAGAFVKKQAGRVSKAGGKKTIITESGWPHAGSPNGKAVPSKQNQKDAIASLKKAFPDGGLYLFSAFDDNWKRNSAHTFNAENHWGILTSH